MERRVIHLFGASGSGTSTLGRFIAEQMDCFFMDTDDYYWMPTDPQYTTSQPISERLAMMRRDIAAQKKVVISGSLVDWGDELIPLFTLAIRVETAAAVRIARLRARERLALAAGSTRMAICMRITRNLFAGHPIMTMGTSICAARRCMTSGRSSLLVHL